MQRVSLEQFTLRNGKVFGGEELLACVPLISRNTADLIKDAEVSAKEAPDVIEWRVDYFELLENSKEVADAARRVREVIGNIPVLFTPRQPAEGGAAPLADDMKLQLIEDVCATGSIDLVDVELRCGDEYIKKVRKITRAHGVYLVLSYHDFHGMPSLEDAEEMLRHMERLGTDVNKLALSPKNFHDVAEFSSFVCQAKQTWMVKPAIISLMGDVGAVSRFCGKSLGSDLSFASVTGVSGPGQMHISDYRILNALIEGKN